MLIELDGQADIAAQIKRTIIIKPTMACNLSCDYCYENTRTHGATKMTRPGDIVRRIAQAIKPGHILFMLHGGEPLLMGGGVFDDFIAALRWARDEKGHEVGYAIQTNATLLTQDWVDRLVASRELLGERTVGISLDGASCLNDLARKPSAAHSSSHKMVIESIQRLKRAKINFGLLAVVGRHNVHAPLEVFEHLKGLGSRFIRFLPCYNSTENGELERQGIRPIEFSEFMIKVFEGWLRELAIKDKSEWLVIDPLASIIANLSGSFTSWCEFRNAKCDNFLSIYPSGEVWLCDSFDHSLHRDAAHIGMLDTMDSALLENILSSPCAHCRFGAFEKKVLQTCQTCEINHLCKGGCLPMRDVLSHRSSSLGEEYCQARKYLIQTVGKAHRYAMLES